MKSDSFALALTDEADELVANLKGQGDPLSLIDRRGDAYADFVHAIVSTPSEGRPETETDPVSGIEFWASSEPATILSTVWREALAGTRHHFVWKCPSCGEWFYPRMSCLVLPDIETKLPGGRITKRPPTPAEAKATAYVACPRNGCVIEDEHRVSMNATGVIIAPGQRITDSGEVVGEHAQNPAFSLFASGLSSPFATFGERAAELAAARLSGRPDKVRATVNAAFGEVYAPGPVNPPRWEDLKTCMLPYRLGTVPREGMTLVAGVDVQKLSLYVVLRAFGARGSSWLVSAEQLHGPTDGDEVWDALAATLTMAHGGLNVRLALIDSGFRPDKVDAGNEHRVYEFCRRYPWLVKPTKGRQTQSVPLISKAHEVRADGKRPAYSLDLVTVDTDHFKSLVTSRIATPPGRAGAFGLPEDMPEWYCRQLVSEVREVIAGKPVWTTISRDNHAFDAEALAAAAGRMLNVERIPEGVSRDWDPDAPPPLPVPGAVPGADRRDTPTVGSAPPPAPAPKAKPLTLRESLADRFADRAARLAGVR